MDPLKRDNPGVRATNHDDRIQALERRIIPPSVKWAFLTMAGPQTIGAGSSENIEWETFSTDEPQLFGTIASGSSLPFNNMPGDTTLKVSSEAWAFIGFAVTEWEDDPAGYVHAMYLQVGGCTVQTGTFFTGANQMSWAELKPTNGSDKQYALADFIQCVSNPYLDGAVGPIFTVSAQNADVVGRDITYASLTVYAWAVDDDDQTDPRVYP